MSAPQGSPEWLAARCGKITASRIADMMARTKNGYGASRANYLAQLVAERLTGKPAENYTNAAMQWGTDTEPQARAAYEFHSGQSVVEVSFIEHPSIPMAGASPDGLIGDDGLIEIKCPLTATHIEYLLSGNVPGKYEKQMQFQMACTGRKWCDFFSFDPRLPERLRMFTARLKRDDAMIQQIEQEVIAFQAELAETLYKLDHRASPYGDAL
mgnify:CR=1 FL=1